KDKWNNIQKSLGDHKYNQIIRSIKTNITEQFAGEFGMEDKSMSPQAALEVAKFFDPTGILSWPDIPPAYNAYQKEPTPMHAFFFILSLTAVLPVGGKIIWPLKMAAKAGKYEKVIEVTPYVAKKIVQLLEQHSGVFSRLNIPAEKIKEAINVVNASKAKDMIPANVFNRIIKDFKSEGGKIKNTQLREKPPGEAIDRTFTNMAKKEVFVNPGGKKHYIGDTRNTGPAMTRAITTHEIGHNLAAKDPKSVTSGYVNNPANAEANSFYRMSDIENKLAHEKEANTYAINAMKKAGASEKDIQNYITQIKPNYKTYVVNAAKNLQDLKGKIWELAYNNKITFSPYNNNAEYINAVITQIENTVAENLPKQLKQIDASSYYKLFDKFAQKYPSFYNLYKKALSQPGVASQYAKAPYYPGLVNKTEQSTFNPEQWISQGGTLGRGNKSTAEGIKNLLDHIGIPVNSEQITRDQLTNLLNQPQYQEKLYQFLKNNPIEIKKFPELYNEISDGNHRFELAKLAGIKDIPATFK
ncbi:MAG: hypothetical protein EBU90_28665, partial [Proteobacteria bacterium]|nr:hypothetical protein [Pseudomonadota bacterium]